MKFIAKAAIPDAEEAIPELWGTYLCVDCKMIVFRKADFDSLQELWIFGLKSSFGFPSKANQRKSICISFFLAKPV
jgi:hypothetical protein